jgi:hypothetical protein
MAKKENTIPTIIDTPEALTAKIAAMKEAQKIFATFTQEQVDKIFKAAATAADKARIPLAKDAVEETGLETISKTFKVWGYKTTGGNYTSGFDQSQNVMDGYTVNWTQQTANTTSSNTADWEYVGIANQTIKYWDYSATSYRFFAYSIPTAAGKSSVPSFQEPTSIEGSTAKYASFSIPFTYNKDATAVTTPYISDLWLSDNQNFENRKYGACVKLTFAPIITKVRFKFNYLKDTKISITDIVFKNINDEHSPTKGNIIVSYPITGTGTKATTAIFVDDVDNRLQGRLLRGTKARYPMLDKTGRNLIGQHNAEHKGGNDPPRFFFPFADDDIYHDRIQGQPD